ncbi:MAG: c-type cytochrome [Omnitrophica WOR_2 bacterium]
MKSPRLILFLVIALLAATISIPVAGKYLAPPGIEMHARMAEQGGWTPANLTASVGQPVHLRLTSEDVTHGFAIGQSSQPAVDVNPGEFTDFTVTFDRPGKYIYYCTRWCGPNHWRMRGTIEVTGPQAQITADAKPLYLSLGIDLDRPHPANILPQNTPSAVRGESFQAVIPDVFFSRENYLSHSPFETWQALRLEKALKAYSDQDLWDMVAAIAWSNIRMPAYQEGKALYAANCAACHGEKGKWDGVMAGSLGLSGMEAMTPGASGFSGHETVKPANFTDLHQMLGASPALLQGKILRGGMGTGMPYWGPIFTEEQTWALVAYIQSYQFQLEKKP